MKDRFRSDILKECRKIDRKHAQFKHQLEQRRMKKWQKFRERYRRRIRN